MTDALRGPEPGGVGVATSDEVLALAAPALDFFAQWAPVWNTFAATKIDVERDIRLRFGDSTGLDFRKFLADAATLSHTRDTLASTHTAATTATTALFRDWQSPAATAAQSAYHRLAPDDLLDHLSGAAQLIPETMTHVFTALKTKVDEALHLRTDSIAGAPLPVAQRIAALAQGGTVSKAELLDLAHWLDSTSPGNDLHNRLHDCDPADSDYAIRAARQWLNGPFATEFTSRYAAFQALCTTATSTIDGHFRALVGFLAVPGSSTVDSPVDSPTPTLNAPANSPTRALGSLVDSPTRAPGVPVDSPTHAPGAPVDSPTPALGIAVGSPTPAPGPEDSPAHALGAADSPTPALGLPAGSAGPVLGVPADSPGPALGLPADSPGPALGLPADSPAHALGTQADSSAPAVGVPADSPGFVLGVSMDSPTPALGLPVVPAGFDPSSGSTSGDLNLPDDSTTASASLADLGAHIVDPPQDRQPSADLGTAPGGDVTFDPLGPAPDSLPDGMNGFGALSLPGLNGLGTAPGDQTRPAARLGTDVFDTRGSAGRISGSLEDGPGR
ncbi:hypothetical protein AB0878_02470 [Amycolatopsis sp. NPDC047767]|uniref:hypothetical protein n=1 Tax=Amycolatopsis sp. NPDC047767 TaxID=3156765 RepID=UPI0034570E4B